MIRKYEDNVFCLLQDKEHPEKGFSVTAGDRTVAESEAAFRSSDYAEIVEVT